MTPQFVDFNSDGIKDMVMGTFEGVAFWVPGSAEGFHEFQRIKDSQDRPVLIADFWNYETEEWDETDRSPEGEENPRQHLTSAVAVDWDGDKDLDLLLGAYRAGALYLQINEGKPGEPSYTGVNHAVKAGEGDFIVPGGMSSMRKVDWNGDGLFDLVCGGHGGGVFLFQNEGKPTAPQFAAPHALVKPPFAAPRRLDEKPAAAPDRPTAPQTGFHIDVVDYDDDGDLDLLVGGYSTWEAKAKKLTDKQQEQLASAKEEAKQTQKKLSKLMNDLRSNIDQSDQEALRAAYEKLRDTDDYKDLLKRYQTASQALDKLQPGRKRKAHVWLYRQKT